MCLEILGHLNNAFLPFVILVIVIMLTTGTVKDVGKNRLDLEIIERITSGEKSRLKGLWIVIAGGFVGGFITCLKASAAGNYQWLYESFAQTSYMFASAVAAMYIAHGYKHADPSQQKPENIQATIEEKPVDTEKSKNES